MFAPGVCGTLHAAADGDVLTQKNRFLEGKIDEPNIYGRFTEAPGNSHRIFTLAKPTFPSQPVNFGPTKLRSFKHFLESTTRRERTRGGRE
jgi:hypothetical protein